MELKKTPSNRGVKISFKSFLDDSFQEENLYYG